MATTAHSAILDRLLDLHGRTYCDELHIKIESNQPSGLFRLMTFALLASTRISADLAVRGADALHKAGWNTAESMAQATWEQRVKVLNEAGYARYDERTSSMLGDTCDFLLDRYRGDLRRLRDEADRVVGRERELLKELKGIGDTGVDIFFREVQAAWDEVYHYVDGRALDAAKRLGLGGDADALSKLVAKKDYPRLAVALVRVALADDYERVAA